ncbi:MAG: class I tRNA ligase family protein [Clostridia bacterium]|nr:class I tRNA ligase family protein [Clostridia bacterium]
MLNNKYNCIMMLPQNVTEKLHIWHALDDTIQDILIRFKRMQGFNTLWLIGSDHSAIATKVKVVAKMKEEEGLTKADITIEQFIELYNKGKEDKYIIVATTRPETMIGDTEVAVNSDDERYKDLIGKKCILPKLFSTQILKYLKLKGFVKLITNYFNENRRELVVC